MESGFALKQWHPGLLIKTNYAGWVMLEDGKVPQDPVTEIARQSELFDAMVKTIAQDS